MITILWSKLESDRLRSSLANYHVFIYLLTVFHALAPFHKGNHLKAQSNKSDEQKPQTINIKYFKCSMAVTTHYTVDLEMLSSMAFNGDITLQEHDSGEISEHCWVLSAMLVFIFSEGFTI